MTSLAKEILRNKQSDEVDETGLPIKDRRGHDLLQKPQYLVARTLILERQNPYYDSDSTARLHLRQGVIYRRNKEIEEKRSEFYHLTGITYSVPIQVQIAYWDELKKHLPHLCPDIFKVCEGLWWDKKNGEIVKGDINEIKERANEYRLY